MRLQRYIAHSGICSRRRAEELITSGRVMVNGEKVTTLGTCVSADVDLVQVDGVKISPEQPRLFLFFKPRNVVSTLNDPQGRPCIADFLRAYDERLYPVGRLDFDVSGLLLLTNNGALCEALLHPRYGTERVYLAKVRGDFSDSVKKALVRGIELEDGRGAAKSVSRLDNGSKWQRLLGKEEPNSLLIRITVQEGRKHFVKRLLAAAGLPVLRLCRISFGVFRLDGLDEGELREVPDTHS